MSDVTFLPESPPPEPTPQPSTTLPPPRPRAYPGLAWLGIGVFIAYTVWQQLAPVNVPAAGGESSLSLVVVELQARLAVGMGEVMGELLQRQPAGGQDPDKLRRDLYEQQAALLNNGTVGQRLRFIVLAGELVGPEEALAELERVRNLLANSKHIPSADDQRALETLTDLYGDFAQADWKAARVAAADRQHLRTQLGWFGELALAPREGPDQAARQAAVAPAVRLAVVYFVAIFVGGVCGLAGLIGLCILLFLWSGGYRLPAVRPGSRWGGVYAETFALWLYLFLGFQILASLAAFALPQFRFLLTGCAMLASLAILLWPRWRGASAGELRQDLGLTFRVREIWCGLATYAMTLPLIALGIALTFVLMKLQSSFSHGLPGDEFNPTSLPAHPIVQFARDGGWLARLQILFLASVCAPVVEEIMFRGVLYRHLREATSGWAPLLALAVSATLTSFVFAVIHPQGWIAVPALMSIAFGMTVGREWRGSLAAPMVMHGIHNGLLMTGLMFALG